MVKVKAKQKCDFLPSNFFHTNKTIEFTAMLIKTFWQLL